MALVIIAGSDAANSVVVRPLTTRWPLSSAADLPYRIAG